MLQTPEEYIARLIFLHFQGIADDKQEQELTEWRNLSPRHEEIYIRLSKQEYWENNFRAFYQKRGRACTKLGTFERTVGGVPAGVTDKKVELCCCCIIIDRNRKRIIL